MGGIDSQGGPLEGLGGFLKAVAFRIDLFRLARMASAAMLAASPASVAAVVLFRSGPASALAAAAPFAAALAASALLWRRRRADPAQAAYFADEILGLRGALPALADGLASGSAGPMSQALWGSVRARIPANPSRICRFRFPAALAVLPAVPLALAAASAISGGPAAPHPAVDRARTEAARLERTARFMERTIPGEPDGAADGIRRLAGRLASGGDIGNLKAEARGVLGAVEAGAAQAREGVDAVEAALSGDGDLAALCREKDPSSAASAGRMDSFAAKLKPGAAGEKGRELASALQAASAKTGAIPGLPQALGGLGKAVVDGDGAEARRLLTVVAEGLAGLRRLRDRAELAVTAVKGAVINLSGGDSGQGAASDGPPDAQEPRPLPAGNAEPVPWRPDRMEKAYLAAMADPVWDRSMDGVVRKYFELLWPKGR